MGLGWSLCISSAEDSENVPLLRLLGDHESGSDLENGNSLTEMNPNPFFFVLYLRSTWPFGGSRGGQVD